MGADGKTYKGASPEQLERLIERAASNDILAGVVGNNVFVVVGDAAVMESMGEGS